MSRCLRRRRGTLGHILQQAQPQFGPQGLGIGVAEAGLRLLPVDLRQAVLVGLHIDPLTTRHRQCAGPPEERPKQYGRGN